MAKTRVPKTVSARQCSSASMVAGGEAKLNMVIDGKDLCKWVGIGWVVLRPATEEDKKRYPRVKHHA